MPCNKASRKMIKVLNDTKNLGSRRFIASEMQVIDISVFMNHLYCRRFNAGLLLTT